MSYIGLHQKTIKQINEVLAKHIAVQAALIYGSRALGTHKNASDIDITLVDANLSFTEFLQIENELDDLMLPYKIDLSQKRKLSNQAFLEHIDRVGITIYSQGS